MKNCNFQDSLPNHSQSSFCCQINLKEGSLCSCEILNSLCVTCNVPVLSCYILFPILNEGEVFIQNHILFLTHLLIHELTNQLTYRFIPSCNFLFQCKVWDCFGFDNLDYSFWNVTSCNFLERYKHFKGICCLHLESTAMLYVEATSILEILVSVYQAL
jgi:hypothetical protein